MTYEARYWYEKQEYRCFFPSEEAAATFLKSGSDCGMCHPIGVWEDGDKILCRDDILEWDEDDSTF